MYGPPSAHDRTSTLGTQSSLMGREHALTTVRFGEAEIHRPLSGDKLKEGDDVPRP
ncbi:protein of unknown function [Paraburkholderia kururiensis]